MEKLEQKSHVSFSELRQWLECPFKHSLTYLDKIILDEVPKHYLLYGSILHAYIEEFLKTKILDIDKAEAELRQAWLDNEYDSEKYIERLCQDAKAAHWNYEHFTINQHVSFMRNCFNELPKFMESEFGIWEIISAEELLYEDTGHKLNDLNFNFKGYVDAIIKSTKVDARGRLKTKYWILDWKTASAKGWTREKIQDIKTWGQLAFYKKFWSRKHNIPEKNIGCAFILLKKTNKQGKGLKRIEVSVGPVAIEKCDKVLTRFVSSQRTSMYLKNRTSCRFCEYRGTEYCDSKAF